MPTKKQIIANLLESQTRPKYEPYADMADICELAHMLTVRECAITGVKVDGRTETGYSRKGQSIYNHFLNLITSTLNV